MVSWDDFDVFEDIIQEYMPFRGEGDTLASQAVTAVNKLVYKWYNDGDVYDNQYSLKGWANDLSDYANWLYKYVPESRSILDEISECRNDSDYEDLLFNLATSILNQDVLQPLDQKSSIGSIYDCKGPFIFEMYDEEDEYDEWEDDDDADY